jgi:hypothetical protein
MAWFHKGDISGSFLIEDFQEVSGVIILRPHYEDIDDVIEELEEAGLKAMKEGATLELSIGKDPGVWMKYWDNEFDGVTPVEFSMKDAEDIKWVQEFLQENGYEKEDADGKWSSHWSNAMKEFQNRMGVAETGTLDQATANMLTTSLKAVAARTTPAKPRAGTGKRPELKEKQKKKEQTKSMKKWIVGIGATALVAGMGYGVYYYMTKDDVPTYGYDYGF